MVGNVKKKYFFAFEVGFWNRSISNFSFEFIYFHLSIWRLPNVLEMPSPFVGGVNRNQSRVFLSLELITKRSERLIELF